MANSSEKVKRWLQAVKAGDGNVEPYYIYHEIRFFNDALQDKYELMHFNLTEEQAKDLYLKAKKINPVGDDFYETIRVRNAFEDISFFNRHPDFTIDEKFIKRNG